MSPPQAPSPESVELGRVNPYADWIGREARVCERIGTGPVKGLVATLQSREIDPRSGAATPLLAHWLYFLSYGPRSEIGPDGHAKRGGFLPPISLERRMWAGGRLAFHRPLRIGVEAERRTTIGAIDEKKGRNGPLVFIRLDHEIHDGDGLVLTESQDLVYTDPPPPGASATAPVAAPADPQWSRRLDPDPVLLFRYSALTFNGHRIHYDHPYATGVEGYPGLVVHGPLIATLLLHELTERHPDARVSAYAFRAVHPAFDTGPLFVCGSLNGDKAELFAANAAGHVCMRATADVA